MSRTISSALKAHLQNGTATLAVLTRITRTDGAVLGFTSHDRAISFGGVDYAATDSLSASAVTGEAAASTTNMEAVGIISSDSITDEDLRAGRYNQAEILTQVVNWADLTMGAIILQRGFVGAVHSEDVQYKVEVRGLGDLLRQRIGITTSRTCRVQRLGDLQCKVSIASYTYSRTVAAVNQSVTGASPSDVVLINVGGGASGSWHADEYGSGGSGPLSTSHAIDVSAVTNPAPQAVYQSALVGNSFTYTIPGLTASTLYTVRLHLCDFNSSAPGKRAVTVNGNGINYIYQYDVVTNSGGQYVAVVPEFVMMSDTAGNIALVFSGGSSSAGAHAICNGIELLTTFAGSISAGYSLGSDSNPTGAYAGGLATWTSGPNTGVVMEIDNHINSGGVSYISFRLPPPFTVTAGDGISVQAGCDRQPATCRCKFNNYINFHGEPYLPGNDVVQQVGRQN